MTGCLCVLLLSGAMTAVCAAETTTSKEELAASEWLDRARAYAEKAKGDDPWMIWLEIAEAHARAGQFEQARAALDNVEDPEFRERLGKIIPWAAALGENRDGAIRFAEAMEDRGLRDEALIYVVSAECMNHRFADAMETVGLIRDAAVASRAWRRIAQTQAEGGQYVAALKSAANMLTETEDQQKAAVETLALIAKAKASGMKRPPADPKATLAQELRRVANLFVGPKLFTEDVAKIKAKAEAAEKADERCSLWREIAWLCHRAGDPDECRQALDTATACAAEISDSFQRSVSYVLIADLVIELGDLEEARELVDKAMEAEKDLGIFRGLSAFTTAPVAVGVLIRCGQIEETFGLARTYGDEEDAGIWRAIGAFCASVRRTDEIEKRLHEIKSDKIKGYLCLGVSYALRKDEMTAQVK